MVSALSQMEWKNIVSASKKSANCSTDIVARTALAVLDQNDPEADHVDTLRALSDLHESKSMTKSQTLRLSHMLIYQLGMFKPLICVLLPLYYLTCRKNDKICL